MRKRRTCCPPCQDGQLPLGAPLEWEQGAEGTGGIVSTRGWMGVLDCDANVLAWFCTVCRREYRNPSLTALLTRGRGPSRTPR